MHLAHYLALLHGAQTSLGRCLREVGDAHVDEADIFYSAGGSPSSAIGTPNCSARSRPATPRTRQRRTSCTRAGSPVPAPVRSDCCGICRTSM